MTHYVAFLASVVVVEGFWRVAWDSMRIEHLSCIGCIYYIARCVEEEEYRIGWVGYGRFVLSLLGWMEVGICNADGAD